VPYEAPDYYAIEELLTAEERMVRDTARRFVEDEYIPLVTEAFREGRFPMRVVPRLAELGFFGSTLPEEYGCAGLGQVAYGLINQELERGDSGLRSFASVQSGLGSPQTRSRSFQLVGQRERTRLPSSLWASPRRWVTAAFASSSVQSPWACIRTIPLPAWT